MSVKARALLLAAALPALALGGVDTLGTSVVEASGIRHSARGSGFVALIYGQPYYDRWSFVALEHGDGSFSGQMQYADWEADFRLHGDVFDLKVDGRYAKVGVELREGSTCPFCPAGFVPRYAFFVVVDNGEGQVRDMISWGMFADEAGNFGKTLDELVDMSPTAHVTWLTELGFIPALMEYRNGNLQVR